MVGVGVEQPLGFWVTLRGRLVWRSVSRRRRPGTVTVGTRGGGWALVGGGFRGCQASLLLGFWGPGLVDLHKGGHELGAASGTREPGTRGCLGDMV